MPCNRGGSHSHCRRCWYSYRTLQSPGCIGRGFLHQGKNSGSAGAASDGESFKLRVSFWSITAVGLGSLFFPFFLSFFCLFFSFLFSYYFTVYLCINFYFYRLKELFWVPPILKPTQFSDLNSQDYTYHLCMIYITTYIIYEVESLLCIVHSFHSHALC